jgi:hypothetical protein
MHHPMEPRSGSRRRRTTASLLVGALLAALLALVPGSPAVSAAEGVSSKGTLGDGYFFVATDGGIFNFGDSEFKGSTGNIALNQPIVGAETTPTGEGYWLVASDGGIFTFGDAEFFGSTGDIKLNKPIVAMVATPTGNGYWLFATDGGVFTFGDAEFFGSTGNIRLNQPIVGADSTATGEGYYLVAADGGIFTFGDAEFFGSAGGIKLNKPIVGMATTDDGEGYYLVATDGGIFSYGRTPLDAPFFGSTGDIRLNQPIVGMDLTATNQGYYLVAADGGIFSFGDAEFLGSTGNIKLNKPIVGMSTTPVSPVTAPDFVVNLRGSTETAGGDPDGNGFGLIDFTDDEVCWVVQVNNIAQASMMHIHRGVAGVNGPVVIDMTKPDEDGTSIGCAAVPAELSTEIQAFPQGFYLNVHNAEFPGGAVRGQLAGHLAIGVTATTGTTANIVLMDTENPAGAVVFDTFDTQGAPVVGIDRRPATGDFYVLLQSGPTTLVLVKAPVTGEPSTVGTITLASPASAFGMDFNPTVDRIRIVSNAGENLRVNPDTAAIVDADPATDGTQRDGTLAYAPGDANAGTGAPVVAGAAYTNNLAGATTTTLYDIDYARNILVTQVPPNAGTLNTVGPLGVDVTERFGFDISAAPAGVAGTALVAGIVTGSTGSQLLAVNLATGDATPLGQVGPSATELLQAFAILA